MFRKIRNWFLGKKEPEIEVEPEPKYLIESFFDVATGKLTIIELVCACGWPVAKFEENDTMEYWCEHCDRGCPEGLPTCSFCVELYMNKHEEASEDED